jgi:DNA-binding GntR family transcriptional regulator
LRSISFIVAEQVLTNAERGALEERIVHDHRSVAESIMDGDPDAASERMREHLRHAVEDFRAYWPHKVGERVQWR